MRATHSILIQRQFHYLQGVCLELVAPNPEIGGFHFEIKLRRLSKEECLWGRAKTVIDCDDRYLERLEGAAAICAKVLEIWHSKSAPQVFDPEKPFVYCPEDGFRCFRFVREGAAFDFDSISSADFWHNEVEELVTNLAKALYQCPENSLHYE